MGLVNRDKDASEQLMTISAVQNLAVAASAGIQYHVGQASCPGTLRGVFVAAQSVSGAPQFSLAVKRWSGAGVTTITYVSTTLALVNHGISAAYQSAGVTAFAIQAGDVFVAQSEFAGGNVAAAGSVISVVMKATQDIEEHFGLMS